MSVEVTAEDLGRMLFKNSAPFLVLLELEREPAHCEALARRMRKGTGYLRKQLKPLRYWGCIRSSKCKNMITYYPTFYGRLVIASMRLLVIASNITEKEVMDQTLEQLSMVESYVHREVSGELFDRSVVATLDPSRSFTERLHILIKTIPPHRAFTREEVYEECRIVFPQEKISKSNVSTCLTRFRDKDYRRYIPNLYCRDTKDFLLE